MKRALKIFLIILGIAAILFASWLFFGETPPAEEITWGVTFSQKQADLLGVPWKENYLALLYDLKVPAIKVIAYWDLIEPEKGKYYFDDLDFQIEEAEEKGVKTILVLGRKVPRWPECHIPDWAKKISKEGHEESLLKLIEKIVIRYHDVDTIWAWQVENEPFFRFGECPKMTEKLLKKEIKLVRSLDSRDRPVIISDSGSNRLWIRVARLGDMVSFSLYRKVWFKEFDSYVEYPFTPVFYWRKALIIDKLFGKDVFCGELQAEPWGQALINDLSLEEQEETMNLQKFKDNIEFARETGLDQFYLWGAEWWYWLKIKKDKPEIWNEARELFRTSN